MDIEEEIDKIETQISDLENALEDITELWNNTNSINSRLVNNMIEDLEIAIKEELEQKNIDLQELEEIGIQKSRKEQYLQQLEYDRTRL